MSTQTNTDRIEKSITLKAARSKVWHALTTAEQFGTWFRVKLHGEFEPGQTIRGNTTYPGYEHVVFEATVEKMEPESHFSYRWHPYAVDPEVDYSNETTTLVEFTLEDTEGGTLLHVVESGFDALPAARRDIALRMNTGGWEEQLRNISAHVGG